MPLSSVHIGGELRKALPLSFLKSRICGEICTFVNAFPEEGCTLLHFERFMVMAYEDILNHLLRMMYLTRDEEGLCRLSEIHTKLYTNKWLLSIIDENVTLRELLSSEEFSHFVALDRINEEEVIRFTPEGEAKAAELTAERFANPQNLFTWAFMGNSENAIKKLAEIALPEIWNDGDSEYGILRGYIIYTFQRLLHERQNENNMLAIVEGDKWACFNTGLVDKLYDPIYGLFAVNKKPGMQRWTFHSWCTPGNKQAGQTLSRNFEQLPRKASYFQKPSQLIYDHNAGIPTLPYTHILERLYRLPYEFLKRYAPKGFEFPPSDENLPENFYADLRAALEEDGETNLRLKDSLQLALSRAVKRVGWNYRLAYPVYDDKRRRLMLLIPLSLNNAADKPEVALIVERSPKSGKYIGHTILTLSMAYKKARMIMRPEADWLFEPVAHKASKLEIDKDEKEIMAEIAENDASAQVVEKAKDIASADAGKRMGLSDAFLNQHDKDEIYRPEDISNRIRVHGKIDLSEIERQKRVEIFTDEDVKETEEPTSYEERGYWIPTDGEVNIRGVFHERSKYGNPPYIEVGNSNFEAREFTDEDLIEDDDVIFDVGKEPNKFKEGYFYYAVNIRLRDD